MLMRPRPLTVLPDHPLRLPAWPSRLASPAGRLESAGPALRPPPSLSGAGAAGRASTSPVAGALALQRLLELDEVMGDRHAEGAQFAHLLLELQIELVPVVRLVGHLTDQKSDFGFELIDAHGTLRGSRV